MDSTSGRGSRGEGRGAGCRFARRSALAAACFWAVARAWAADPPSSPSQPAWRLGDCIRLGIENGASARSARLDVKIGDAMIEQARSAAYPKLTLSGNYTRLDEVQEFTLGDQTMEIGTLDNYSVQAGLEQWVYSGGRVGAGLRAARAGGNLSQAYRMEAESRLVRDIRKAFHGVILARESIAVRRASMEQFAELARQAEQKWRNGAGSELEWLSARVRMGNEAPELSRATNAYELARANLGRLMGHDGGSFEVAGELVCRPLEARLSDLQERAVRSRAALSAAEQMVRLKGEEVVATRSGTRPEVRVGFRYSGANSMGGISLDDEWQWHWNAWLGLTWSLWDGFLTREQVRQKTLEQEKAKIAAEDLARVVRLETQSAYLEAGRAREAAEAATANMALAQRALGIAKARYDAGLATHLEVVEANTGLLAAGLARLAAMGDHMNAMAELDYAAGVPPDEILGRVP